MLIHTPRLRLITFEADHLAALVNGPQSLGDLLKLAIPDQWPAHPVAYREALSLLGKMPLLSDSGWWLYLFVSPALKSVVGCGGFRNAPDADGVVRAGCETAPAFRRQGFASEALRGLISYAFTRPAVRAVEAWSLPARGPQSRLAEAVGMKRIGEVSDPIEGDVWRWQIARDAFERLARGRRR
jgi:RimJ/RimL family protein N-acetyltransferase